MAIFLVLIPLAFLLGLIGLGAFMWALKDDQFDDLDRHGMEILRDEADPE